MPSEVVMHLPARGHMKSLPSVEVAAQLLGRWLAAGESEGLVKHLFSYKKEKALGLFSQYTYYDHVWCFILVFLLLPSALSYLPLSLWGKGEVRLAS